jgi:AcrR family transcriptional regulator
MSGTLQVRHTRDDWLEEGIEVLAKKGHRALGVSRLARRLGVTKGSFYWHFKNVAQFHDALLEHWYKRRIRVAVREAKTGAKPAVQLTEFLVEHNMPQYDLAIREWARTSAKAAKAIEHSEGFRKQRLAEMLVAQGIDPDQAAARSQLVIWAWRGSVEEANPRWRMKAMRELIELVMS